MVDRDARNQLAQALRQFLSCRINNDRFDDLDAEHHWHASDDEAVRQSYDLAYSLYDDLTPHFLRGKFALSDDEHADMLRCILFLHTDHDYEWPDQLYRPYVLTNAVWLVMTAVNVFVFVAYVALAFVNSPYFLLILPWFILCWLVMNCARSVEYRRNVRNHLQLKAFEARTDSDLALWPFRTRAQYEHALQHPHLLRGAVGA
jgi:hypothetical protein